MSMSRPLEGVRVLDLSRLLPGPFCSLLLSDLGANVVKVEDMSGGDYTRMSPPHMADKQSGFYHFLNRGKRSMKLNLKQPEGVALLKKLVRKADIVLESFRPGVMDKLGVGYETLKQENPGLIYCCISGYGWSGPYKHKAGHDINYLAYAGVLGVTGRKDSPPSLAGVQIADVAAGSLFAAVSILAALNRVRSGGEGAFIDTSMTDGAFSILGPHLTNFIAEGAKNPPRTGDLVLNGKICAYTVYETKDGRHMSMGALEPKFWQAFIQAVERPELMGAAFTEAKDGEKNYEALKELFASKTLDEWIETLKDVDCCVEPILLMDELLENEHFRGRGLFRKVRVGDKEIDLPVTPFNFGGELDLPTTTAPRHGEHTEEFLKEMGLSEEEISVLRDAKAIG